MTEMKITSIKDLSKYAEGTIVQLPSFGDGQEFIAKLRRPSLLALAKSGKVPNVLLETASNAFPKVKTESKKSNAPSNKLADTLSMFEAVCEASFVQPTWEEIKESGVQLTDEQYTFVFQYAQQGVKALENFRNK